MFEKEAEELVKNLADCHTKEMLKDAFKDGAEFGYNKTNEWHYVKDGDYPKDNKPVLCIQGEVDSDIYEVGYYNDVGNDEPWHFETYHLPDDDGDNTWGVSAWQKINPPKKKQKECV